MGDAQNYEIKGNKQNFVVVEAINESYSEENGFQDNSDIEKYVSICSDERNILSPP
jgi:hypothetical protein